uniref:Uncharacterized protein n=1 Tax=Alexandrium monilatum TaxID=311494 RepID=A0A6T1DJM1_9DINO|mmetsp:Transcript_665/g.2345  ORF Transcript_665/g.2345 Transcript_665/m.2345 type:complete len:102 (-) Transcript_665:31-336(-)
MLAPQMAQMGAKTPPPQAQSIKRIPCADKLCSSLESSHFSAQETWQTLPHLTLQGASKRGGSDMTSLHTMHSIRSSNYSTPERWGHRHADGSSAIAHPPPE